jgi:hypothetical protein
MAPPAVTLDDLHGCLTSAALLELKGMGLLKERPHLLLGGQPIPRGELVEAVAEIVAYTGRCRDAARQLADLPPIPLLGVNLWEFGL